VLHCITCKEWAFLNSITTATIIISHKAKNPLRANDNFAMATVTKTNYLQIITVGQNPLTASNDNEAINIAYYIDKGSATCNPQVTCGRRKYFMLIWEFASARRAKKFLY
jgi:hypothetical protein